MRSVKAATTTSIITSPIVTYIDTWTKYNISPKHLDINNMPTEYETAKLNVIKTMNICEQYTDAIELKVYESSELSVVFISNQKNYVYQYFKDYYNFDQNGQIKKDSSLAKTLQAINSLTTLNMITNNIEIAITYNIGFKKYNLLNYSFNLHQYIVNFFSFQLNPKILVWEKITPLNKIPQKNMKKFIRKNFTKLTWDIMHGLYAMHLSGRTHGDCSIDNIGYRQDTKTFILYDFDMSEKTNGNKLKHVSDVNKFFNSLEYRGELNKEYITSEYKDKEPIDVIKKLLVEDIENKMYKNKLSKTEYINKMIKLAPKIYKKFLELKIQ